MPKRVDLTIKLTPPTRRFIQRAVGSGLFPDEGACVEGLIRARRASLTDRDLVELAEHALRDKRKPKRYTESDWQKLRDFAAKVASGTGAKPSPQRRSA